MLVAMRKHTKTIFIVIIILIVPAFIFFYVPQAIQRARGGEKYGTFFGRSIRVPAFYNAVRAELRAIDDFRRALITMDYRQPQYSFLRAQRDLYLAQLFAREGPSGASMPPERVREQVRLQFTDPETEDYDEAAYRTRLRELGMSDDQYVNELGENIRIINAFLDPVLRTGGEYGWELQRRAAWRRLVLAHEAKRLGLAVSDQDVVNYLYLIAGRNGDIDDDRYNARLRSADMSRKEYEDDVRTTIQVAKLQQFVLESVKAPQENVVEQFNERYRAYKLAYHLEPSAAFLEPQAVRDDEAEAFFIESRARDEYLERFSIKPKASVMYVLVETADFLDAVTLDEEQVKAYYETHRSDFAAEGGALRPYEECADEVRAAVRQIEAVKLAREEATRRFLVSQPGALIQNAARYTRPNDVKYELHYTPLFGQEGEIDGVIAADEEQFRKAVFGLVPDYAQFRPKPGQVIGPVRVSQGWCVLALVQMVPDADARTLPRDERLAVARDTLARERAADVAARVAGDLLEQIQALMKDEALSFAQACTRLDLDAHETAFFTADDDEVPGLEHSARLRDLAQSIYQTVALGESKPNEVYSEPLEEDAGTVLWMLAETRLPDEQTVAREQARFAESVVRRSLQTHAYFEWYLALDEDAAIFDIQYEKQLAELKAQQTRGTGGR